MATIDLNYLIKAPNANVFRRAYIKRRNASDGLFESGWTDISKDVKKYGKITSSIDAARLNKFTFNGAKLVMENSTGKYNPSGDQGSLWYGYLNQQRTLIKIDAGFTHSTKNDNGIYVNSEFPSESLWDVNSWDAPSTFWDSTIPSTLFTGIVSGDIVFSDTNEVTFNIKPLQSIFQEYPARLLSGWTTTGVTASQFVGMIRDQTDGAGQYVFRPFFGDTTTYWDISTTSNIYSNLNSANASEIVDKNVWEVVESLAEAENFIPYVSRRGVFKFISKTSVDTATAFEFHGTGSFNTTYGHTIKRVNSYGFRISKYYSSVQIKFRDADTITSYYTQESTITVSAASNPWVLGSKSLKIENFYIPNTATASNLANTIFTDVSALKNEIEFETTFIPHLDLFDRFSITYDPNEFLQTSLWDQNNWAEDDTSTASDLIFDKTNYDSLLLNGQEFKFLSIEFDIDNFSNRFIAREV